MKFGISNLSWKEEEDDFYRDNLKDYDYIETVFPRINHGYYSTQSIFYGSNVKSFEDFDSTFSRLNYVIDQCHFFGIRVIVLGSPSLRKGNRDNLVKIFGEVDSKLKSYGIYLCVEPNSKYYGGEYYHNIFEIVSDIYSFSNVKTMIDTHNLFLEGCDLFETYLKYFPFIKHIHFSEKDLVPISDYSLYNRFVDFLYEHDYNLGITYELKQSINLSNEVQKFVLLKKQNDKQIR